jgi:hypothetical protein
MLVPVRCRSAGGQCAAEAGEERDGADGAQVLSGPHGGAAAWYGLGHCVGEKDGTDAGSWWTDGLRLQKRMLYFVPEGSTVDAAPFLRMIRNDTGYMQYAASHLLAVFLT